MPIAADYPFLVGVLTYLIAQHDAISQPEFDAIKSKALA